MGRRSVSYRLLTSIILCMSLADSAWAVFAPAAAPANQLVFIPAETFFGTNAVSGLGSASGIIDLGLNSTEEFVNWNLTGDGLSLNYGGYQAVPAFDYEVRIGPDDAALALLKQTDSSVGWGAASLSSSPFFVTWATVARVYSDPTNQIHVTS